MEWQPIETAPKDGSFVLLGCWKEDVDTTEFYDSTMSFAEWKASGRVIRFWWAELAYFYKFRPRGKKGEWVNTHGDAIEADDLTHWANVPEPPPIKKSA